jgi:ABC-type sugar transport system substrate-binding protein
MLKKLLVVFVAIGLIVGVAACGSSGSSSSGSTGSEEGSTEAASNGEFVEMMGDSKYSTPTLESKEEAEEKGEAFASETNPKPAKLAPIKVGVLLIAGTVESVRRSEYEFVTAAKALGWSPITCDAQGLTTGFTSCMNTLLNQGAKAIATIGIEPSLIAPQLAEAKAKGVPVIEYAGKVEMGGYSGAYYPDDAKVGQVVSDYFIEQVEARGGSEVAEHSFPAGFTEERLEQLTNALKSKPEIKVVQKSTVDAADPVGSAAKATETAITQFPNLAGILETFDTAIAGDAQAIATKLPGKTGEEIPLLVGFNANLGTQVYMRKGIIAAVGDVNYVASGWVAADQLAEYFGRETALSKEPRPEYPIEFDNPKLVKADELPEGETYIPDESNYQAFFKAKWKKEFGVE